MSMGAPHRPDLPAIIRLLATDEHASLFILSVNDDEKKGFFLKNKNKNRLDHFRDRGDPVGSSRRPRLQAEEEVKSSLGKGSQVVGY